MSPKRPSAADAMGDIAPPAQPKTPPPKTDANTNYARYGKPATYRLPPELISRLKETPDQERVKSSDQATFALRSFNTNHEAGQLHLPHT